MSSSIEPDYLQPYLRAVERHGEGFHSLLWANPKTQSLRFDALCRLCNVAGHSILDVGCGRADLLDFLLKRNIKPDHYTGLEAVETLANAARRKAIADSLIVQADFVAEPARLFTAADVIVFSGSLNTLNSKAFYAVLRTAHAAAVEEIAFNFLNSPLLAGTKYLHWHALDDVLQFAKDLGGQVDILEDYIEGDCTVRIRKAVSRVARP